MRAAGYAHLEVVKYLIEKGANVNLPDENGRTPLWMAAAAHDSLEVVKCLVANGANIDQPDNNGKKPIDVAADHPEVVAFLYANSVAKPHADEQDQTPVLSMLNPPQDTVVASAADESSPPPPPAPQPSAKSSSSSSTETSSEITDSSSLSPTNAAGGNKEATHDADSQCTNADSKQSMQCCGTEPNNEPDLDRVVLYALSLIYHVSIEKLKDAIKNGKIPSQEVDAVKEAVSLLHLVTATSIQIVKKGSDVYITLPDGKSYQISRKYPVVGGEDKLEEDSLQPDPTDLASSLSSGEAKPTKFDYDDQNLPQFPLQKPESLPPYSPSCTSGIPMLIGAHSGFISYGGFISVSEEGTHSKTNITVAGESTSQTYLSDC